MEVAAELHDLRDIGAQVPDLLDPDDYTAAQAFAAETRALQGQGIAFPSVRGEGDCVALFFPDLARNPVQGRHLDYHWNGDTVDLVRDAGSGDVFRVV